MYPCYIGSVGTGARSNGSSRLAAHHSSIHPAFFALLVKPLSPSSLAVLSAVSRSVRHGFDIMDATSLPSGTVYPVLGRLERDGYVRSKWESQTIAQREKRPPRRYYEITASGARALAESAEHYRTLGTRLGLPPRRSTAK
jgi:PadR family transcriptional regulator PadR